MGFASFVVTVYPSAAGAFFLKFGLGGMRYQAKDTGFSLTATAPAGFFGLGYDIRVGNNLSVTPYLNSLATSSGSFAINGVTVPAGQNLSLNLVQIGVALSSH